MTGAPTRRTVLGGLAATATGLALPLSARAVRSAKIVIVGGGFGGMTAARTLAGLLPGTEITLVEPNPTYTACPFSNLVIGGLRDIKDQQFGYGAADMSGITVVRDSAESVDPEAGTVLLSGGAALPYDRLILSPGIAFRDALEGYDTAAMETMPHAWKAGSQTLLLRDQLAAMEDGGLVVMSVPPAPFRCPPGPYERASLIANYLKTNKPRSKLLILDGQDRFSKQPLFEAAWARDYPGLIEHRGASMDGRVVRVDGQAMTLHTDFEDITADVANVIPPQKAGTIAAAAGVADATGWCPINPLSFESALVPSIHVLGDATIANPMPKSAFSANLQGKICAIAVARLLANLDVPPTILMNTCYSYVTPDEAISISGVYSNADDTLSSLPGTGGLTPLDAGVAVRQTEAGQAQSWFASIIGEVFG